MSRESHTPRDSSPDITELLEAIMDMRAALGVTVRYCDHPDVLAIPFAQSSKVAAERARRAMEKASKLLNRAGYEP